jgi:capsular polysaccharide biosynthesis protein
MGPVRVVSGIVANVLHHGPRSFAHVLADALPRIWLVREAGIEPDAWLVPDETPEWLSQLLDIARIPTERRIPMKVGSVIRATQLVVPDRTGFALAAAPWASRALAELFGSVRSAECSNERIWISRGNASRRRWLSESCACLELQRRGFLICSPEMFSVREQYSLIAGATVIAGPHGAGLVWCLAARSKRGLLFEVAGEDLVHNDYRAVACIKGWQYARSSYSAAPVAGGDNFLVDINATPESVLSTLDAALAAFGNSRE